MNVKDPEIYSDSFIIDFLLLFAAKARWLHRGDMHVVAIYLILTTILLRATLVHTLAKGECYKNALYFFVHLG